MMNSPYRRIHGRLLSAEPRLTILLMDGWMDVMSRVTVAVRMCDPELNQMMKKHIGEQSDG